MKQYFQHDLDDALAMPGDPEALDGLARQVLAMDQAPAAVPPAPPAQGWRQALDAAIAADPKGKQGVADRLGVSRPYVSRICSGDIPVASPLFVQRVIDAYMQVNCPHLGRCLPPGQCRSYAQRSYAQITTAEVPHWRACRRCEHNPDAATGVAAMTARRATTPQTEPLTPNGEHDGSHEVAPL